MTNELEVNELIEQLEELLEQKNYRAMKPLLDELPAADIAEFLEELTIDRAMPVFRSLPKETAVEVFSYFEPETQEKFITSITLCPLRFI